MERQEPTGQHRTAARPARRGAIVLGCLGASGIALIMMVLAGADQLAAPPPPKATPTMAAAAAQASPGGPAAGPAAPAGQEAGLAWGPPIPGLAVVDVTRSLSGRGLRCRGPDRGQTGFIWSCRQETGQLSAHVDIYATDPAQVVFVAGTILQHTPAVRPEVAAEFLGYLATVPYTGAEPRRARAWVFEQIAASSEQELTIAGVRFILFGPPRARSLQIRAVSG